jgi:hypothetical protein
MTGAGWLDRVLVSVTNSTDHGFANRGNMAVSLACWRRALVSVGAAQSRTVGPSTWSGGFAFWDVMSTTPFGEVVVMTDLVALLTLANNRLLVPWLALSSAQPMGVCECTPSATDCCLRIASVRGC